MNEVGDGNNFGIKVCIGGALGGKGGVDVSTGLATGTINPGWGFDGSLGVSGAATILGGVTGGCSMSFKGVHQGVKYWAKCKDFGGGLAKMFSCGAGLAAGIKAGVSAGLKGCAQYVW